MKKLTFALIGAAGAWFCSSFLASANGAAALTNQPVSGLTPHAPPLRWSEIGAKAGADYHGDGLSVTPAGKGARLRCAFQRLEGEATTEGLWLVSTVTNAANDRFRVVAASVGRNPEGGRASPRAPTLSGQTGSQGSRGRSPSLRRDGLRGRPDGARSAGREWSRNTR